MDAFSKIVECDLAGEGAGGSVAAYKALLAFRDLVRGGVIEPCWQEDGRSFLYRNSVGATAAIRLFDASLTSSRAYIDEDALRAALERADPQVRFDPASLRDATLRGDGVEVTLGDAAYLIDRQGAVRRIDPVEAKRADARRPRRAVDPNPSTTPPLDELPSPDGGRLLTLVDHNLAIRNADTGTIDLITTDGEPDDRWVLNGARWSPDGKVVAALRRDTRAVARLPVVHWLEDINTVDLPPYPIATGPPVLDSLALVFPAERRVRTVWSSTDGKIPQIAHFGADGSALRFLTLSRDITRAELQTVDVATGQRRLLLDETSPTFLYWWEDVFQRLRFYTPLSDGRFVWASERGGFNQLYLHDASGALVRVLTTAAYPVVRVVHVDEDAERVFFLAHPDPDGPYDTHLMRVDFDGGGLVQLSRAAGEHNIMFCPAGDFYLDVHSSVSRPPRSEVRNSDGELIEILETADVSPLDRLGWSAPEPVVVKAADGRTDIAGLIYKPIDFAPSRKYPVVEYIYGGGFKTLTPHGFFPSDARGVFLQALVQLGFIGVIIDARGTPGRSKAFQDVVHTSFGQHESADHAEAIRQMASSRSYMDLDRVGIFGISFGGYFTVRCLLQQPDLYKVGVALSTAEIGAMAWDIATAPYLGPYDANPERYAAAENARLADRLAGNLLLVTGSNDVNTPIAHTMKLADAFIRAGKSFDMLVVPEANHPFNYSDGRSAMPYVQTRIADYFLRRLVP